MTASPPRLPGRVLADGWLALAWVAGTPTLFSVIDTVLPLPVVTPARACFLILAVVLILDWLASPPPSPEPTGRWLAAFLLVMTTSLVVTTVRTSGATLRPDATLLIEGYVMAFVAYKAGRRIRITRDRLVLIGGVLAGVGLYLAGTGILQQTLGWNFVPARLQIVHPMRMVGPFGNGVYYAAVQSLLLLMALFVLDATRGPARIVLLLSAAAMLATVVLARGRAPLLALAVALGFVAWKRPGLRRVLPATIVLAAILVVALLQRPQQTFVAPEQLSTEAVHEDASLVARAAARGPIESRIAVLAISANMAWHHPLLGLGFGVGTFVQNKDRYFPDALGIPRAWAEWPSVPHNEFLFVLVSAGLVGLMPFVGLQLSIWRRLSAVSRSPDSDAAPDAARPADLAPWLLAGQLVFLGNALFVDLVFFSDFLILFYFLVGLGLADVVPASRPAPTAGR